MRISDWSSDVCSSDLVKVFSNGVLGDQPVAVRMLKAGELDIAEFNLAPLSEAAPGTKALTLPFLFRDATHMFRKVEGKLGPRFEAQLAEARTEARRLGNVCVRHCRSGWVPDH